MVCIVLTRVCRISIIHNTPSGRRWHSSRHCIDGRNNLRCQLPWRLHQHHSSLDTNFHSATFRRLNCCNVFQHQIQVEKQLCYDNKKMFAEKFVALFAFHVRRATIKTATQLLDTFLDRI